MNHIQGMSRDQVLLFPERLDDYIPAHHLVRVIDAYIDTLDFLGLGFTHAQPHPTGRPSYHPGDLLKLYVYGYMHRVRSSRELEKQSRRNIEVMWLINKLTPSFKTIADFRRDNGPALRRVFRHFTLFCRDNALITGERVVIDGSKFKAVNSKERNLNERKLKEKIKRIDQRIEDYLKQLDEQDAEEEAEQSSVDPSAIEEALKRLKKNKQTAQQQLAQLHDSDAKQISLTDADARAMRSGQGASLIGYNVQTVVDSRHKLLVSVDVSNEGNDRQQLYPMAKQAKELLALEEMHVVADSGYSNEKQVARCHKDGIIPALPKQRFNGNKKQGDYCKEQFHYDPDKDCYRCPQGHELTYRSTSNHHGRQVKLYRTPACKHCAARPKCTQNKRKGREIARGIDEDHLDAADQRFRCSPELKTIRKQTVEHPFGTLKRGWNQGHFLMKSIKKVKAEISLSALAYNLTRAINTLGVPKLLQAMV